MTSPPAPAPARSWTIELPLARPLSLNGRQHWRAKARDVRSVRAAAAALARAARVPPLERAAVELHYIPRDRRRRDALNLVATLKPVEDGIVDAGVVPDDTAQYVEPTMPVLDPPARASRYGRLYVVVRELVAA